jgi:hypothetical protein
VKGENSSDRQRSYYEITPQSNMILLSNILTIATTTIAASTGYTAHAMISEEADQPIDVGTSISSVRGTSMATPCNLLSCL